MKRITFRADERAIELAQRLARAENTTLAEQFWLWRYEYGAPVRRRQADEAMATVERLQQNVKTGGRKFTREEMNER